MYGLRWEGGISRGHEGGGGYGGRGIAQYWLYF